MGLGQALCRNHKMDPARNRINLLRGGYQHAVRPLPAYAPKPVRPLQADGSPQPTFASTDDPVWQEMLAIVREARRIALDSPRVDMPGADIISGESRMLVPPAVPREAPPLKAHADERGDVHLRWEHSARIIGLACEIHRSQDSDFSPNETTLIARTELSHLRDKTPPSGTQHYALVLLDEEQRSRPSRAKVRVRTRTVY